MSASDTDHSLSFPVFYDKSGRRLRRLILTVTALVCVTVGVAAWLIPQMFVPTRTDKVDDGFARRYLATGPAGQDPAKMPIIGIEGGVMTRIVSVVRDDTVADNPPEPAPDEPAPDEPAPEDSVQPFTAEPVPDDPGHSDPASPDDPPAPRLKLVDAVSGEYIRDADDDEREQIGNSPYAIDYFGRPADHTLMLTFDDGPDPAWTQQILDILSREHVPATFFVVGRQVAQNPELFRRIISDGHMAGNHTLSHLEFGDQPDWRNQEELIATDRIMRAVANYASPLFRIPTGDPELHSLAQLQAQQLGYLQIDMDLDTNDWRQSPGEEVPVPPLDGRSHVLLMHDAGGRSRAGTVAMLQRLIAEAKAQGYTFTTLAPILPPKYLPQKNIRPSFADRLTGGVAQLFYQGPRVLLNAVIAISLWGALILSSFYLVLSSTNQWRQRRKVWPDTPEEELPFVTVALAAYNEEKVITRTLDALRASDYPASRFQVIAVNDGSTDDTLAVLQDYARQWPSLRVINQQNSGKSWALNNAVYSAAPHCTVVITLDADTLFRRDVITRLARHFIQQDPHRPNRVGVVAGHVKVGNRRNVLTAWQSLEYVNGICIARMAEMMVGAITVVPGACSAWRRDLLTQIGGFSHDTLAEDADAAMKLQQMRYRVLHDNLALCDTEAPETLRPLLKQRKRWMFGNFQVMWKNRHMLFRPKYGILGMVTMPYAVFQIFLNLVFLPALLVANVMTLAQGVWQPTVATTGVLLATSAITPITAVVIAREKWWHLLVILIHRPIYEVLRFYLLYTCAYRVIKGAEFSWDKLERLNSVAAVEKVGAR